MSIAFTCPLCGELQHGMPAFFADAPSAWHELPEEERGQRGSHDGARCTVDDAFHFLRACIELPVHGTDEHFVWGVWVAVGDRSLLAWDAWRADPQGVSMPEPFLGWLDTRLSPYPDTKFMKVRVHLRGADAWPWLEFEKDEHPLARERLDGITLDRVAELHAAIVHEPE